jgi:hypothetical protein
MNGFLQVRDHEIERESKFYWQISNEARLGLLLRFVWIRKLIALSNLTKACANH